MDGTGVDAGVTAVLDAARDDIVAARRARHQLLIRVRELQDLRRRRRDRLPLHHAG